MTRLTVSPALLIASTVACSDAGEATGGDATQVAQAAQAGGETCALPSGGYDESCNACLAASCCEQVESCKANADCAAQLACVVECQANEDPGGCSASCPEPDGFHAAYLQYDDCSFNECLSTCWM